jgi:ribonucleoside-triphosphate reductase
MKVIKRDGREAEFDKSKIEQAILKAFEEVDSNINENSILIAHTISESIEKKDRKRMRVEEIQDIVEEKLMASKRKDVAKQYILYRNERTKIRDGNSRLIQKVSERMNASNVENANANVDEKSFSGREKEASGDVQKFMAFELGGLSDEVATAHKEMRVYEHDADKALLGEHNCANVDFPKQFDNGFKTRNGDVRPPSTVSTACQQVAVIFQCQSQVQFGGVGSIHLDYDLNPFVKKSFIKHYVLAIIKKSEDFDNLNLDNMTEEELDEFIEINTDKYLHEQGITKEDVYIDNKVNLDKHLYNCAYFDLRREGSQSAEALYHNLNTLESRQGSQVPFTSINFGRDTSTEGRLVSKWMLEASLNGIGKYHLTSIFPISIFQYKQGTNANKEDKNYDLKQLALKSMSK